MTNTNMPSEIATLGGGCFWCLEAVFNRLMGVLEVESGYAGGHTPNPTYQAVCMGKTGHAEVAQIRFDPTVITFKELLEVFFAIHDPTTLNRQGADVGTQYRSVIFTHSESQQEAAKDVISDLTAQHLFEHPIVTEVVPLERFYRAEDYHQRYYDSNPAQPYCQVVISPKIATLRKKFSERLRNQ